MTEQRRKALKLILQLLCQLLWIGGLAIALTGVFLLVNYRRSSVFLSNTYIILPAIFALAVAVTLVASGYLGTWMSQKDSSCLQGLFIYLLVLVFCLEITASALAYFYSTKLNSELAPLHGVFMNYTGSSQDPMARAVDITQEEFMCCGIYDYKDWLKTSWFNSTEGLSVPRSCCNTTFPSCNGTVHQPWKLYSQGCHATLEMVLHSLLNCIIWGCPFVLLVEVVLLLMTAQLMMDRRLEYHILGKN
ncbi:uncharacterized protein V6R79_019196 [Siganus canaliculatus]